jgi:type III pantothenate kinase
MLLAIDIGNTSVHFGIFEGEKLLKEWREAADRVSDYQSIRNVIVSSVVPGMNKFVKKWFPEARFVNYRNIGIKIKVKKPSEVGVDRLVNALAAHKLYGGPAIIVDFGTATTFDVVSARGEYLGGAIVPGIQMSIDALHEKTAKLPKITLKPPKNVIGNSTVEAIRSGILYGYVSLVEGMLRRIKSEIRHSLKSKIKIIATGGLARLICKHTDVIDRIDPELTLKGIMLCQKN